MKLLVILCGNDFDLKWRPCVEHFYNFLKDYGGIEVDYIGISSSNDFANYEDIIYFKHKIINPRHQFHKICDFISNYKDELDYDWFIKIRPDLMLLEPFKFDIFSDKAINARARVYRGPKRMYYGMSVNGPGKFKDVGGYWYDINEKEVILDDMFYCFHKNIVDMGAFDRVPEGTGGIEWDHTSTWKHRNIGLNVIGINFDLKKHNVSSGHLGM